MEGYEPVHPVPRAQAPPASWQFDLGRLRNLYFHCFGNMKTSDAIDSLAALAQATRLDIFRLLVRHAPRGLPAGTIARRRRLPGPTLSFHLNVLAATGLVRAQKKRTVDLVLC